MGNYGTKWRIRKSEWFEPVAFYQKRMLYTGAYERTIDDKGRLQIPSQIRAAMESANLGRALYLTPGSRRGTLSLYPANDFERLAPKTGVSLNLPRSVALYHQMLYSRSWHLSLDNQHRILLPEIAIKEVKLAQDAILTGVGDHMDIWNKADYYAVVEETAANWEQLLEDARLAGIPAPSGPT